MKAPVFISACRQRTTILINKNNMNTNAVDVLLVEDNINDAEMTVRELKKNYLANNIFHVHDGAEALQFIFAMGKYEHTRSVEHPPKLILLDIHMPKINGLEVLKKIKADERTNKVPVVILTSSNLDPDIKLCYELGANSYIVKPVNFESFTQAIHHLGFYWLLLNRQP